MLYTCCRVSRFLGSILAGLTKPSVAQSFLGRVDDISELFVALNERYGNNYVGRIVAHLYNQCRAQCVSFQ